ncbi:hypothetical protein [Stieleria magnilauensis]
MPTMQLTIRVTGHADCLHTETFIVREPVRRCTAFAETNRRWLFF